ncbi:ATP-binding cassette domain-containing protein [Gramella sp. AN32]|uniref:ATP-binding cassette domain-containing protein n=1 Tax=Christiangramia antarctica TaxID=2058158 RepID=A0ABW5X643_9FLAO|nr:ATP-binding cassette domain-containing protein [Gramella sp. AN32]MCM4157845.1 ABC transporter ATP-binding protein [Gramella sp. AN32]
MKFELDNVELYFGQKQVLYSIYFKAETGKITGLLGPNGSGKSSLMRVFFGNLNCHNKLVRINDQGTLKPLYKKHRVKLLPQHDFLPNNINFKKIFNFFEVEWSYFVQTFPSFEKYSSEKIGKLSGGEKRLISVWLILKSPAELVLLDEPFTHLSPLYIEIIKKEMTAEKENKGIVISDHMYHDIVEISDDLYFLKNGNIKKIADKEALKGLGYC